MSRERRPSFAAPSTRDGGVSLDQIRSQSLEKGSTSSSPPSSLPPSSLGSSWTSYLSSYIAVTRGSPLRYQAFSLLVLIQFALVLVERSWVLGTGLTDRTLASSPSKLRETLWFFTSILVSAFFVCYFAMAAVMNTNYFEMWACRLSSVVLLVRLAVEVGDSECAAAQLKPVCYAFLALQGLCIASALFLSISMASDIKWKRYYFLGTLVSTQRIYRTYELFMAVRLLDLQCSIVMVLTGLVFFTSPNAGPAGPGAIAATLVVGCLEVAWERASERAVRGEDAKAMYVFWALSPWLPVAVAALGLGYPALLTDVTGAFLKGAILLSASLALLARATTVVVTVVLFREFGPNYVPLRRLLEAEVSQQPLSRRNLPVPSGGGGAGRAGVGGGGMGVVVVVDNVAMAAATAAAAAGGTDNAPGAEEGGPGVALGGGSAAASSSSSSSSSSRVEEWASSKASVR